MSAHTSPSGRITPNSNLRGFALVSFWSSLRTAPGAYEGGGTAGRSVAATRVTGAESSSSHVSATHSLRPGRAAMSHEAFPSGARDASRSTSAFTVCAARAWKQAPNGPTRGLAPSLGRIPDATESANAPSAALTAATAPFASNGACVIAPLFVANTLVTAAVVSCSVGVIGTREDGEVPVPSKGREGAVMSVTHSAPRSSPLASRRPSALHSSHVTLLPACACGTCATTRPGTLR